MIHDSFIMYMLVIHISVVSVSQQGTERVKGFVDVQQPQRDSDLPFELRGELV